MAGKKKTVRGKRSFSISGLPLPLIADMREVADKHDRSLSSVVRVVLGMFLVKGINGHGPGEVPSENPEGL